MAGTVSRLFGVPQAKLAFQCLALLPHIKRLTHLDVNRLQRELKYGPSIMADSGANLLVTLAVLPLALWLRGYWAMVGRLSVQTRINVSRSHLFAARPSACGWHKPYGPNNITFRLS